MSWNYRVVRFTGTTKIGDLDFDYDHLAVHGVFYDENGKPVGMTKEPERFTCDTEDGKQAIIDKLELAIKTIRETEILDDPWPDGQ